MNILFTCAGRRNYLINYFKTVIGANGKIIATDSSELAPALYEADIRIIVPSIDSDEYLDTILNICRLNKVDLLIPLIDLELPLLAKAKSAFESIGTIVMVSDPNVINICSDKLLTYQYLLSIGLNSPKTYISLDEVNLALDCGEIELPLVIKPRWGSASIGIEIVKEREDIENVYYSVMGKIQDSILKTKNNQNIAHSIIIQERVEGYEYGLDIVNDFQGVHHAVFVKRKYSMRSGETDKAVTQNNALLRSIGSRIGHDLKHIGNLDCDLFICGEKVVVLEMNPRFGGGYPFSHEAGANIPAALIAWLTGDKVKPEWLEIRYDHFSAKCDRLVSYRIGDTLKKREKIVIIGAGGHARETKFLIESLEKDKTEYKFVGYLVSDLKRLGEYDSKDEVLGDISWLDGNTERVSIAIGIGAPKYRISVANEIRARTTLADFPIFIHPNAIYDRESCVFEEGVIIGSSCVLTVNIHIKEFSCLNRACLIGHEAYIGAGCLLNPGAIISGGVVIGDGVMVGTGATILQYLKIGDGAVIGAGSVVTKDVPPGVTVVGIPAIPLNK